MIWRIMLSLFSLDITQRAMVLVWHQEVWNVFMYALIGMMGPIVLAVPFAVTGSRRAAKVISAAIAVGGSWAVYFALSKWDYRADFTEAENLILCGAVLLVCAALLQASYRFGYASFVGPASAKDKAVSLALFAGLVLLLSGRVVLPVSYLVAYWVALNAGFGFLLWKHRAPDKA